MEQLPLSKLETSHIGLSDGSWWGCANTFTFPGAMGSKVATAPSSHFFPQSSCTLPHQWCNTFRAPCSRSRAQKRWAEHRNVVSNGGNDGTITDQTREGTAPFGSQHNAVQATSIKELQRLPDLKVEEECLQTCRGRQLTVADLRGGGGGKCPRY